MEHNERYNKDYNKGYNKNYNKGFNKYTAKEDFTKYRSVEDVLKTYKHICWYPSAGSDFRGLLYLSKPYYEWKNVEHTEETKFPELFIMTDFSDDWRRDAGYTSSNLLVGKVKAGDTLYWDRQTDIAIQKVEFLKNFDFTFEENLAHFPEYVREYKMLHRAILMRVRVYSRKLGEWETDILYIFAENLHFALECLIPKMIWIDYLILIRYGEGFGQSNVLPNFFGVLLDRLKVKHFITNYENYYREDEKIRLWDVERSIEDVLSCDKEAGKQLQYFASFGIPRLEKYYEINGEGWSGYGPVGWFKR